MNHIADILVKTLKKMPGSKKIMEQLLIDSWPEAAGDYIAAKTQAFAMEQGTLLVRVSDSVWAQHLALQKKRLIKKLNRLQRTRMLKDIRFLVGTVRPQGPQAVKDGRESRPEEPLTAVELAAIEAAFTKVLLPEELAESMKKLFITMKKKQKQAIREDPVCANCGLPLVRKAQESYCLRCKSEDLGQNS
ncbi:MAG: DUF721 domain-containing protein [Firmicutes bacterium]|nr:DUF721 domain-containing protein [Bacillota bacterium]